MRIALMLALGLAVVFPATALAKYDPVGGGDVKLVLDKRFAAHLKRNGIKLEVQAGARLRKRTITFPASGGILDASKGRTKTKTRGTLIFRAGKRRLPFRRVELRANRNPLVSRVGGGQLKVAVSPKPRVRRIGFGAEVVARPLRLTAKVATRLQKKLAKWGRFERGQRIGTLRAQVDPQVTEIVPQGRVYLVPSPTFLAKLEAHFVSLNPIAPAELAPGPVLSFPISGGALSPAGVLGTLMSSGSFELLQLKGGQVFFHEPWADLGALSLSAEPEILPSPPHPGRAPRAAAFSLALPPGSVSTDPKTRTIAVNGGALTVTPVGAAVMDQAFSQGKGAFIAGESLGTLSFAAVGR